MTPSEIVELLSMQPHPEGGWYIEIFRDGEAPGKRPQSTAIYYMLEKGQRSHWHKVVDAAEVWHYYAGDPLKLSMSEDGRTAEAYLLGADLLNGQRPQIVVPTDCWQSAESTGDWTLVGCTVSPGFVFDSFEMAPPSWAPGL